MVFPLKPRSCRLNVSNRRYTPENQRLDTQNDGLENDSPFWYLYVKFLACTLLWNNNCSASMIVLLGIHGWSIRYHPKGLLDSSHQHYQTYMISIFFNLISNLILYHIKPTRTSISRFISKHRGFLRIYTKLPEVWRLRRCLWWQRWKYLGINVKPRSWDSKPSFPQAKPKLAINMYVNLVNTCIQCN